MQELDERFQELTGRYITDAEAQDLAARMPRRIDWLLDLMRRYPLIGTRFRLEPERDLSGLGVDMSWMTPQDIVGETFEFYPGIAAVRLGYIAIGICLCGSGDPYFLKGPDANSPLVRIPHDHLESDLSLSESVIEVVRPALSDFFRFAQIT